MAVLVVAEHDNASVKDATNKTVTAALALSSDVDVLVAGLGAGADPGGVHIVDHLGEDQQTLPSRCEAKDKEGGRQGSAAPDGLRARQGGPDAA